MGVLTTASVSPGKLFGPIPPTLTLTDPVLMIGHMTADSRPEVHTVKLDLNTQGEGAGLIEWVPYVRAARDIAEQNLEAVLVEGHLFYRTIKNLSPDSELFVWYTPDLARVVGVPDIHPAFIQGGNTFICPYCCKEFTFPFSLRAHMRFKCERNPYLPKLDTKILASPHIETLAKENLTFLENNISPPDSLKSGSSSSVSPGSQRGEKRKRHPDFDQRHNIKRLEFEQISPKSSDDASPKTSPSSSPTLSKVDTVMRIASYAEDKEEGLSAFRKVDKLSPPGTDHELKGRLTIPSIYGQHLVPTGLISLPHSSSMPVRHAHLPPRMVAPTPGVGVIHPQVGGHPISMALKENIPITTTDMVRNPIRNTADLRNLINNRKLPFHPDWRFHFPFYRSQNPIVETLLQTANNGNTTPFLPQLNLSQNWCAKCNATFRMTSDLVYHMRSHHKEETKPGENVKKAPKEKLKCDVCGETFKERHHLTRHMTSHQEA